MKHRKWKKALRQSLQEASEPRRLEETVWVCAAITRERAVSQEERRTDFWRYLSDAFRYEAASIVGLQLLTLFIACLGMITITDEAAFIPIFMPLFALALMPVLFRSQAYGMSEIEAATRASGAQIMLAKLILAGAANLVCMTAVLCLESYLQDSWKSIGRLILYALVPYLVCVVWMLRSVRLRRRGSMAACMVMTLGSCVGWGISAKAFSWLYETAAMGVWVVAFLIFSTFFIKEILFIAVMRKEGKMYGIVA